MENSPRKIIRAKAVSERTSKSRSQIWRDVKAKRFPAPIVLGPSSIGWYEDEIDAWLESRPRRTYGGHDLVADPVSVSPSPAREKNRLDRLETCGPGSRPPAGGRSKVDGEAASS